jgi:hypothetical protein
MSCGGECRIRSELIAGPTKFGLYKIFQAGNIILVGEHINLGVAFRCPYIHLYLAWKLDRAQ